MGSKDRIRNSRAVRGVTIQDVTDSMLHDSVDEAIPENALVPVDGGFLLHGATLDRRGLILPEKMSEADYYALGKTITAMNDALQLWVGDWLVQGEYRLGIRADKIAEQIGRNYKTVRNYKWGGWISASIST